MLTETPTLTLALTLNPYLSRNPNPQTLTLILTSFILAGSATANHHKFGFAANQTFPEMRLETEFYFFGSLNSSDNEWEKV